jgi:hypothetical protein
VLLTCEALGVSRSGFYAWMNRPRSQHSLDDKVLGGQVQHRFVGSDRTYGLAVSGMTCWRLVSAAACTPSSD